MLQWIAIHLKSCFTKITALLGVTAVLFCFSLIVTAVPAHAQTTNQAAGSAISANVNTLAAEAGASVTDVRVIIARIIRVALGLLGIIAILICLYGGYLWMTAGGNDEQIASAKKVLTNGVIGLIVILSAYSIVLLVMRALTGGSDGEGVGVDETVSIAGDENFYGSGGLGGIIKDHYPDRNAINIPRNAKIIITFKKPINLASVIENTNGSRDANNNEVFGDCRASASVNWETDCDQLKRESNLITIKNTKTNEQIRGAAALSSAEGGQFYTIVIRPNDRLGSEAEDVAYAVRIGDGIQVDDSANGNPSIFAGRSVGRNFYEWNFTTNNTLDLSPPHVSSVFPLNDSKESKNSIIQIDFSEAIDPTGVQGAFADAADHYVVEGNVIYTKAVNSKLPAGEFRLTNGYRTLEFTPTMECGTNACGGTIFCLSVCDKPGATCKEDLYSMLLKAGQTFSTSSFESLPFSGIMDVSGNALDSNNNKVVNKVPSTGPLFPDQQKADNYYWKFTLEDKVDMTAPYLKQVTPGPNISNVSPDQELSLLFSKRMRIEPMYSIVIEEQPASTEQLCRVPRVIFNADGTTKTDIRHCPFKTDALHYYFPVVGSGVEDVKFNCFYPGKGPITADQASKESDVCDDAHPENCCQVDKGTGQVFCCNGFTTVDDTAACIAELRSNSPINTR